MINRAIHRVVSLFSLILLLCLIYACEVQKNDGPKESTLIKEEQSFLPDEQYVGEQFLKFLPTISDDLKLNTDIESLGGKGYNILLGDLNNDSLIDAIVDYSLVPSLAMSWGGNAIGEIAGLVYFKNTGDSLVAQVHSDDFNWGGNSGSRIELQKIENGKIYLQSFEYAPDDGRCCPSIPNTTIVRVDDNDFWLR